MNSRSPPQDQELEDGPSIQAQQQVQPASENGEGFLIIKDCNPWFSTANVDALEETDFTYGIATSDEFVDMDLAGCHTLIIPSTQTSQYYSNLADAREKIATFVDNGGTLIAHVADLGYPCTTTWSERFLPGSIAKDTTFRDDLQVADSEIFGELTDTTIDGWNSSTHGIFTETPADTEVLASTENGDDPTYVRYPYGDGVVLATMQTVEWPWSFGEDNVPDVGAARGLLRNEIAFADERRGSSVSCDVDVLSFIPGESENSTRGGSPFNGAVSQFLPADYTFEVPLSPEFLQTALGINIPEFIEPTLEVDTTPLFDNWGTGDMILSEDYPINFEQATRLIDDKYEEPGPDSAPQYRTLNGIDVSFETDTDGSIDESSIEVVFTGQNTESVLEQEDVNTLKDDVEANNGNALEGGYRPRHYSIETTTVDGTEAVRVGTIFGGYTRVGAQALELLSDRGQYEFLTGVLEWEFTVNYGPIEVSPDLVLSSLSGLVDGITTALAAVPNIYSHLELTLTADGRQFIRLWDHSPFPEHAVYVENDREFFYDFPDEEGTLRELLSPQFTAFLVGATIGRGPYYGSQNQYLRCISEGDCPFDAEELIGNLVATNPALVGTPYADEITEAALEALNGSRNPVWSYSSSDEAAESVLPDDPLDPFDERESHADQTEFNGNV